MLILKSQKSILLKEAVASLATMNHTEASIYYNQDEISLYVCEVHRRTHMLMAVLHLRPSSFEIFDCGKPGHIVIDLNAFSELLSQATDNEAITINFGDIRKTKTYRGDKTIKFRFKDLGTGQTRLFEMDFSKANRDPLDRCELQYDDLAIGIPAQEFNRVFTELDIPGEKKTDDLIFIFICNEQLKFSTRDKEIILAKELGQYKNRGAEIKQPIKQGYSVDLASSYLRAVKMTDRVWLLISNELGTLLKCQLGQLGDVLFDLYPCTVLE